MGFPKIMSTILGVPIISTIVFGGLYWGPLILGNYHTAKPWFPKIKEYHLEGPHNKDSILGSPYLGKLLYLPAY